MLILIYPYAQSGAPNRAEYTERMPDTPAPHTAAAREHAQADSTFYPATCIRNASTTHCCCCKHMHSPIPRFVSHSLLQAPERPPDKRAAHFAAAATTRRRCCKHMRMPVARFISQRPLQPPERPPETPPPPAVAAPSACPQTATSPGAGAGVARHLRAQRGGTRAAA